MSPISSITVIQLDPPNPQHLAVKNNISNSTHIKSIIPEPHAYSLQIKTPQMGHQKFIVFYHSAYKLQQEHSD